MMFKPLSLLFFCFFSVAVFTSVQAKPQPAAPAEPPSVVELEAHAQFVVNTVNAANAGWTAKLYPRFARMSPVERRAMHGLKMPSLFSRRQPRPETPMLLAPEQLPEEFDPRQKWPECTEVINNIRDQSRCGDCWAISAAGAFSDRICIASGGKLKVSVSGIDTASCAEEGQDGCQGASDLSPAWLYFQKSGAVTGSNYTLKAGCKPYPFPPSDQATRDYSAPVCAPKCTNRRYRQHSYVQDKHYVSDPIEIHSEDWHKVENLIKQEVLLNGSVTVGFAVYTDFMYYHSGVYKHTWGGAEGGHAVRLVGWGVDKSSKAGNKNTPYWLIANSWGPHWGEAGFFRIQRGTNEAEIEGMVDPYAGAPRLE